MRKSNIAIDITTKTIIISKVFYKKATAYGTAEYKELRNAIQENPTIEISFKTVEKKTYRNLTFEVMEAYIITQPNSEANLIEFAAVKTIAEAKGSKYPLTKKWFLATFPEYKNNEVSKDETKTITQKSESNTNTSEEAE